MKSGYSCSGSSKSVCSAICGDGLRVKEEKCDDGNKKSTDGCAGDCSKMELNFNCKSKFDGDSGAELDQHPHDTLCK